MARDSLNAEIARQRQAEIRRAAERHSLAAEFPARPRIVRAGAALARDPAPMSYEPERATVADLAAVAEEPREFWAIATCLSCTTRSSSTISARRRW